ncbi:MAG: aldose epimerase family protein [Mucilaginibacter sp.]
MIERIADKKYWGTYEGRDAFICKLNNAGGASVTISNFGATIIGIKVRDAAGNFADVALGYDQLEDYIRDDQNYMGCVVGRFANRIAGGSVELDGKKYQLTIKEGGFHHHGGKAGFNKKMWDVIDADDKSIRLNYISPDGEEGFPGELSVSVTYTLNDNNQLLVDYEATTNKTTLLNLTQHTYFNLSGCDSPDIYDQELMMPLDEYLPVTGLHVPDGTFADVAGSPFDFRKPKAFGKDIDSPNPFLVMGRGYDNTWVIKKEDSPELKLAARVTDPNSGRILFVYTTEPSVHLYTGNWLGGTKGKNGVLYNNRGGFCLETQHYPDAPNHVHFPSTVLREGEVFRSRTIFEFDTISLSK